MLTKDGSRTLNSERYGETYHSVNGALTEARHVFLDATGVTRRLQAGKPTHVLEIGFGLGLNTLLCADLADQYRAKLTYHSFEHALVSAETLHGLGYGQLLADPGLADALGAFVTSLHDDRLRSSDLQSDGLHGGSLHGASLHGASLRGTSLRGTNLHGASLRGVDRRPSIEQHGNHSYTTNLTDNITLTLHLQDASIVDFKAAQFQPCFHAIFLDAFSPETNAECWSLPFIAQLAQALASGGTMSTYSAKGAVRRAMLAAGLTVTKLPGPPGKREMLLAQRL